LNPIDKEKAKPFEQEMDFAFFAVNFGYSKRDYLELTDRERMFIYKAYENKTVSWTTLMRDAVSNAVGNAMRKKNEPFVPLWQKKPEKADMEVVHQNMKTVLEIEKNEKGWIEKIYEANGKKVKRNG